MAITSRGKAFIVGGAALLLLGGGVALALSGNAPTPIQQALSDIGVAPEPPQPCPLTGQVLPGDAQPPERAVLAVKVENAPESRPQVGMDQADIVYEEPVEGGVTRFIVLFHCDDAARLGPVRSARMTDISVLAQYGEPLFGYAGGAPRVRNAVAEAPIVDVNYIDAASAYTRDESRVAPHNLYTTTKKLYKAGGSKGSAPAAVFTYDAELGPTSKPARTLHIPFSSYADVIWSWDQGKWIRAHGDEPHVMESGKQIAATNIVVMKVKVSDSDIVDVAGYASPEVDLVGTGKAWILRDGRVVIGRWVRDSESDLTRFETTAGEEIALAPGVTWVELVPTTVPVEISAKK